MKISIKPYIAKRLKPVDGKWPLYYRVTKLNITSRLRSPSRERFLKLKDAASTIESEMMNVILEVFKSDMHVLKSQDNERIRMIKTTIESMEYALAALKSLIK